MASENIKNVSSVTCMRTTPVLQDLKDLLGRQGMTSVTVRSQHQSRMRPEPGLHQSQILPPRIQWAGGVIVPHSPQTPIRASG